VPQLFRKDSNEIYRVAAFDQFDWLEHGFGTRHTHGWPDADRIAMVRQVHSASIIVAENGAGYIGTGDALITNLPGRTVGVRTADCVPILLVDSEHRAVAAVHAGWRGTAQRIVMCTISALAVRYWTTPSQLYAAIGPAIGSCCYEVGADVASKFAEWLPELKGSSQPVRLDLEETNRRQLALAGLSPERIFTAGMCTSCTPDAFHSYRRDREQSGRMISAIGIRE
jgi:YfiH family protein